MIPCAVVGITGYTGQELARLLAGHPDLHIAAAFGSESRDGSVPMAVAAPALRGVLALDVQPFSIAALADTGAAVVFLATPHEASASHVPAIRSAMPGVVIADLSAAFRFADAGAYPKHYGFTHPAPGLLAEAIYGMPELSREGLAGATLIACAGCYVTAASIPLHALRSAGLIDPAAPPIVDAVSGVSGAGRGGKPHTSFCEVASTPYGAIAHRHRPEIQQAVGVPVVFQPHLGPFARGILATIHVRTPNAVGEPDVMHAIASSLGAEPFVRILGSAGPDGGGVMPNVASVQHTNFIDVAWAFEPDVYNDGCGHLIVYSAIDNLTKGASGQAVQCINAAIGLPETAGLLPSHASKGAATCA